MSTATLVRSYTRDVATLTRLGQRDLSIAFGRALDPDATKVRDALAEILPGLVSLYGAAAGTLAADWYDELRDARGIGGRFRAIPAELPDEGRTEALAGWAVSPLFAEEPDPDTALTKLDGGLQRIIANAGRETVTGSSSADSKARGWTRTGSGGSCEFCSMLLSRGAVYTEASADFLTHDHCNCGAEPVFGDG